MTKTKDKAAEAAAYDKFVVESITLSFKGGIATDGQINRVQVFQYGRMIQMTKEQAQTLAKEILRRFPQ